MFKKIKRLYEIYDHWMGYEPPGALSSKGWGSFNKEFRKNAPIRYYFHRKFRNTFVYPIKRVKDNIKYWIRYRTYDKYHVIDTGLKPGYYSIDWQMLHVNFNILKEFVEVETAWHHYICSDERKKATFFEKYMPFYRAFFPFRDPAQGIKHLDWAATLDDPKLPPHERSDHQAKTAREVLILYKWWMEGRPARVEIPYIERRRTPDPDDIFGEEEDPDPVAEAAYKTARYDNMMARQKQEEEWAEEDTEMLCRLIRIRDGLWT